MIEPTIHTLRHWTRSVQRSSSRAIVTGFDRVDVSDAGPTGTARRTVSHRSPSCSPPPLELAPRLITFRFPLKAAAEAFATTGWRAKAALSTAFAPGRYAPSVVGSRFHLTAG